MSRAGWKKGQGVYEGMRHYLDQIENSIDKGDIEGAKTLLKEAREFLERKLRRMKLGADDILRRVPENIVRETIIEMTDPKSVLETRRFGISKKTVAIVSYLKYKGGSVSIKEMADEFGVIPARIRTMLSGEVLNFIEVDGDVIRLKGGEWYEEGGGNKDSG